MNLPIDRYESLAGDPDHDPAGASTPRPRGGLPRLAGLTSWTYRSLSGRGLAPVEAGNLTAYLTGLRPVARGWTVAEIDRVLFLRHLVDHGRLVS